MTKTFIVFVETEDQEIKAHVSIVYKQVNFFPLKYEPGLVRIESIHDAETNTRRNASESLRKQIELEALRVASLNV